MRDTQIEVLSSGGRHKVLHTDSATATLSANSFALSGLPVQEGCLDQRLRSPSLSTLPPFPAFRFDLFQQFVAIFRSGDDFCMASFTQYAPGFLVFTPLDFEGSHAWLPLPLLVHPLHVISVYSSVMLQTESTSPLLKQADASIPRHQHSLLLTRFPRRLTRTAFTHALKRGQLEMLSTHSTHFRLRQKPQLCCRSCTVPSTPSNSVLNRERRRTAFPFAIK